MSLPEVLEQALDAENAYNACDRKLHPRIKDRLSNAHREARRQLRAVYPELEDWLFGYPYRNQAKRLAVLRRLVTP